MKTSKTTTWFVTVVGAVTNIVLSVLKVLGGILTNSSALIADGIHSLTDLISDAFIIYGERYWIAPADSEHRYGHARFETLVNLFLSISLLIVSVCMVLTLVKGSANQQDYLVMPIIAIVISVASVIVKELLYRWTLKYAKSEKIKVLEANAHHHRSDALSSLPVLVALLVQLVFPSVRYIDDIGTIIVALMIGYSSIKLLKPIYDELTEKTTGGDLEKKLQVIRFAHENIKEVHKIRIRTMGSTYVVDLHALVSPTLNIVDAHAICTKYKHDIIKTIPQIVDVIIHIEPFNCDEKILNKCK